MDPTDPRSWFGQDADDPQGTPPPTRPVHTPTPQRPQGFLPFVSGVHGFSNEHGFQPPSFSPPLFPPSSGPSRRGFSPISRMSSFEDDDSSSPRTAFSLADETDDVPETQEFSSPPRRVSRGRRAISRGGGRRGGGRSRGSESDLPPSGDDGMAHPYTEQETLCLGRVWVDIGSDPVTGVNQRIGAMWGRIAQRYNEIRPEGTPYRHSEKLRNHWKRAMADIKQFESCYKDCRDVVGSGESHEMIVRRALADFAETYLKQFKHMETWLTVRETSKFRAAFQSQDVVKRCKNIYGAPYSTSESEHGTDEGGEEPHAGQTAAYRPRPEGSKAAKARRGKAPVSTSYAAATQMPPPVIQPPTEELDRLAEGVAFQNYFTAYVSDTSQMNPDQLHRHSIMLDHIERKLGLPSRRRQPPPSDSASD